MRGATARDDLSRFFAPEIAARITADDDMLRPGFGEVRHGAVLVVDIRGFTSTPGGRPARSSASCSNISAGWDPSSSDTAA